MRIVRWAILFVLISAATVAAAPAHLQSKIDAIMYGGKGTAVLLDVRSNKIIAAYHPDVAARTLALPGSAVKPFTLLALIDSGKLKPEEKFLCRRNVHIGNRNLACSHPETGQPFNAATALAYSCNDYFTSMAVRLTAKELRDAFVKAGFSSPTGLVRGEAVGSVQVIETREQRQLQAVGEFGVRITPLELLAGYRELAQRLPSAHATTAERTVYAGLQASTDYGMARLGPPKGLRVAGKTGTSRANEGPWTHGWFAGFAPADNPQVAVVVFLERGTGPADAAPLAAQILQAWMAEPK
jgi:cell division protein FtsI/penicillin-binding protein 2